MSKSFSDIAAARRARSEPEAKAWGDALADAYSFAIQLITLREARGITQAQLAEMTGIDQGDISRIERGSANPTAKTLQRIAQALDARFELVAN